jgi:hypothetical protein
MKPASAKQKGRKEQQIRAHEIRIAFDLPEPDAVSTSMGKSGIDIMLSTEARKMFPFAVEVKCQESLNIWESLQQSEENGKKEGLEPIVIFRRNGSKPYVALDWHYFLRMQKQLMKQGSQ